MAYHYPQVEFADEPQLSGTRDFGCSGIVKDLNMRCYHLSFHIVEAVFGMVSHA